MGRHTWMDGARDGARRARRRVGHRAAAIGLGLVAIAGLGGVGAVAMAAPATPAAASPCEAAVKACARLSTNEAWLTDGAGTVVRGPVRMNHGAPGKETPTGMFAVQRKEEVHLSKEYDGARMPWAVFFDDNGRAFHGGDPSRQSAGCVRMADPDAQAFFNGLEVYDKVQILP
ncbi:L,D-transpeptidase [Actinomycetospora lemnae]|uniref:L,D-transpeptidase n=1 Tax=Actinomycetospora lemnae TaxID=3019891 RepID=A0ABT5SYD3_9PSEU|nr:L,D-transpeptidase [Actinomycetospora sp. DW7H6]MDD7967867.1 L,D-transpeptidase [Actinomycetospora sp. DW7H6]